MRDLVVYAMDVGSTRPSKAAPKGAFGWARASGEKEKPDLRVGTRITEMLDALAEDASRGAVITLGVEAPLWLPIPSEEPRLSEGRAAERSRSCFAPAGGYVATLGLHQLAHILTRMPAGMQFTLDWKSWSRSTKEVLIWEAFVSADAHARGDETHSRDAATAAVEFLRRADALTTDVAPDERGTMSLAGAALLWSSRGKDVGLLSTPTLVLRPGKGFTGAVSSDA